LKSQLIPFLLRAGEESDPSDTGGVEAHGGTWMQVITCNFKRYVRGKYPATLHGTLRSATGGYTWHLCAGNALDIHILFTVLICPTSVDFFQCQRAGVLGHVAFAVGDADAQVVSLGCGCLAFIESA